MSTKHTKGPWYARLGQFSYTNSGQRPIMSGPEGDLNAVQIALVSPIAERKRSTKYDAPDPERDANARLIAAAPDLLEALELIEVDLTAGNMPLRARVTLALDRARAAIAKAKGE